MAATKSCFVDLLVSLHRKENAAFKARVLVCDGSVELLDACGFKDQGEQWVVCVIWGNGAGLLRESG